jgi:phosphoribosyl 1,2-cyclic phosphodiesterase
VFRFGILGSGSQGNALLVESDRARVLIDCGFSLVELTRRMAAIGAEGPRGLDAIVVTHCHGDHISGIPVLSRALGVPIYVTPGTRRWTDLRKVEVETFTPGASFSVGDIAFDSIPLCHDAPDTVALKMKHAEGTLGLCTDLGEAGGEVLRGLAGCDTLLLESNYDPKMLETGPYPAKLKKRVAGRYGHLSNEQSHDLLAGLLPGGVRSVHLSHLSENNNTPEIALACMAPLRRRHPGVDWHISPQRKPAPFVHLAGPRQGVLF